MVIGIDASRAFTDERTGTENYSYHLITHMLQLPAGKKHTFVLFIRPNAKVPKEIGRYSNVIVREIKWKRLWTQGGLALATRERIKVEETWQKLDVLWIPAHTLPVLRKRGLKTVVTIHGLEYKYLPEYQNLLQRWYLPLSTYYAAKEADKIIAVSQATKADLLAEVAIPEEKVRVILEGVTAMTTAPLAKERAEQIWEKYGITAKKYVLFVGTVQPRKNLGALITAFAEFYQINPDYKLVLAGQVGWEARDDLAQPERLGIPEAVIWTGRVEEAVLRALYQGAAVYVQPSWTEGFGLPVLEAMQAGVATIVSSGGALPEVVGETGKVVALQPQGNFTQRLSREIAKVLGDAEGNEMQRKRGKARVSTLSWQRAAEATLETLVL